MIRRAAALRRIASSYARHYHASSAIAADALDMVDTFARRHGTFLSKFSILRFSESHVIDGNQEQFVLYSLQRFRGLQSCDDVVDNPNDGTFFKWRHVLRPSQVVAQMESVLPPWCSAA